MTRKPLFSSCVESIQISFSTVPNVSSLYQDPRSVPRVFRLLGRGKKFLADRKFSIWNILKGNGPKRASLFAKFDNAYKKAVVVPEVPILADDGDVTCGSGNTTSNSSPSPNSNLGRATIALARCAGEGASTSKVKAEVSKGKKD